MSIPLVYGDTVSWEKSDIPNYISLNEYMIRFDMINCYANCIGILASFYIRLNCSTVKMKSSEMTNIFISFEPLKVTLLLIFIK